MRVRLVHSGFSLPRNAIADNGGRVGLADLFAGRRQLLVYARFEPGVHGWPDHACVGCALGADQVSNFAHLNARDTTLSYASRAPQADIARLKARMALEHIPWHIITDSFDADFGVDGWHGHNAFIRDGGAIYRIYFVNFRSDETLGTVWSYLDMTALGRQEDGSNPRRAIRRRRGTSGGTGTTLTRRESSSIPHGTRSRPRARRRFGRRGS